MTPSPTLQALIDSVKEDADSEEALGQLAQASRTVGDLEQVADALLGHFVDQCRRSGHSWSEISTALGVSKQAAHKRFTTELPTFERFTERARKVLVNCFIDHRRRPWVRREGPTETLPDLPAPAEESGDLSAALLDALRRLPPRMRAAVVLRHVEDLSVEDVAAALGCSTGNVKSQTARGLEKLRAQLATIPVIPPVNPGGTR